MKHLIRLVAASFFATTVLFFTAARPAHAACLLYSAVGGQTVTATYLDGHSYTETFAFINGPTMSDTYIQDGDYTETIVLPNSLVFDMIVDNSCNNAGPTTWFTPGDGRVDPRPGDRLAVYCNPGNIAVFGLINNVGKQLIDPNLADVVGKWQSFSDGMGGTVSIGGSQSSLTVQWYNSTVGATGTGDFAKTVSCNS